MEGAGGQCRVSFEVLRELGKGVCRETETLGVTRGKHTTAESRRLAHPHPTLLRVNQTPLGGFSPPESLHRVWGGVEKHVFSLSLMTIPVISASLQIEVHVLEKRSLHWRPRKDLIQSKTVF